MQVYELILLMVAIVATAWIQNLRSDAMLENGYIDIIIVIGIILASMVIIIWT